MLKKILQKNFFKFQKANFSDAKMVKLINIDYYKRMFKFSNG